MSIPKELEEFKEAAKPLIKWLNDNYHPHHIIIVEHDGAELLEGNMRIGCDDYLKD